jgi:hypothetical protein
VARFFRFFGLMLVVLLSACYRNPDTPRLPEAKMPTLPAPPTAPPHLDPAAIATPRWDVVIAAGDASRQVSDDAVLDFHDHFDALGLPIERLRLLSADAQRFNADFFLAPSSVAVDPHQVGESSSSPDRIRRLPGATDPASPAMVLRRLLELSSKQNGACLAYLISSTDGGALKMRDGTLGPDELDRALGGGCANAPTVVIVSGCDTGGFATGPMARPNRLILTAAASGRSGFGCGPNVGLTTFDECFLGSLDGAGTWIAIFDRTRRCVRRREQLVDQPSVEPQEALGDLVTGLPAPWKDVVGPNGVVQKIVWRRGIGRFSLDGTPYFPTLRQRNQAALEAYRHAAGPKALALTFAGTIGWAGATAAAESPEDVARLAIQRCELQSGGSCILFARGDGLAANGPSGYPPLHPPMLQRSGTLDIATVPFIRDDQRGEIAAYAKLSGTKALALGPDSEAIGTGTGTTLAAARAAALQHCAADGGTCLIFAEGDQIVLGDGTAPAIGAGAK